MSREKNRHIVCPVSRSEGAFGTDISHISDYEMLCKIGEGTFGEVYRARHKHTGLVVAVKKFLSTEEGFPLSSIREIKALRQTNHPNVISLCDMAVSSDPRDIQGYSVYMVFPYMAYDLVGLLDLPIEFNLSTIRHYMKKILEGIDHVHSLGLIHRDMKSSNLLIGRKGELKIADFGLARRLPAIERDGSYMMTNEVVTRWYRPPELLLGSHLYNRSADMWGIALIALEFFTRRPVFQGKNDSHQLEVIVEMIGSPPNTTIESLKGRSRKLRDVFFFVPEDLLDSIDKILVFEHEKRLTARQMLETPFFQEVDNVDIDLSDYPSSHELDKRKRERATSRSPDVEVSRRQTESYKDASSSRCLLHPKERTEPRNAPKPSNHVLSTHENHYTHTYHDNRSYHGPRHSPRKRRYYDHYDSRHPFRKGERYEERYDRSPPHNSRYHRYQYEEKHHKEPYGERYDKEPGELTPRYRKR